MQSIRPTLLRTRIIFDADIQSVLAHGFETFPETKVLVCREELEIRFHEKYGFNEVGLAGYFKLRSSSPISGIIRLSQVKNGSVGEVEGKVPFSQVAMISMFVIGLLVGGISDFSKASDISAGYWPLASICFIAFVLVVIMVVEAPRFAQRIDEIARSFNKVGIETKREDIQWSFKMSKKRRWE